MRCPAVPRDAATVVLLRESPALVETLLLRRLASMSFAGGEWVFPGGTVDPADRSEQLLRRTVRPRRRTLDALRRSFAGVDLDDASVTAICVAACRETFEESGILIARHSDGAACSRALSTELQESRGRTDGDAAGFAALLEAHDLVLELDRLVYWASWITPSIAPRRFDTRFFIVAQPAEQDVGERLGESQAARWLSLDDPAGPALLDPPITVTPTLFTLRELAEERARRRSLAEILRGAEAAAPAAVMLKIRQRDGSTDALLPWDSEYAEAPGDGVPCDASLRQRFSGYPSRLEVDSRFVPAR